MKRHRILGVTIVLMITLAACGAPPAATQVPATSAPAATATATALPPTATSVPATATATEAPPLPVLDTMTDVAWGKLYRGQLKGLSDLFTKESQPPHFQPGVTSYTGQLASDKQVFLGVGWCAKTIAIGTDNKQHMRFSVTINGQGVPQDKFTSHDFTVMSRGAALLCTQWAVLASAWPAGKYVVINTNSVDAPVNDGWDTYAPGDYTEQFTFTVTK